MADRKGASVDEAESVVVIEGVRIVPMDGPTTERGTVVIRGARIESLSADAPAATLGATIIDGAGLTVLPGLIDAHVHLSLPGSMSFDAAIRASPQRLALQAPSSLLATLASGTTLVRDVGGIHDLDHLMKRAVLDGELVGPDLQTSGRIVGITGGHGYFLSREADGPDEIRKATREQLRAGADWIKLMGSAGFAVDGEDPDHPQLDPDELEVAVREATKAGKPTAGHAHPAGAIKDLVRAGVRSVEHASFMDDEAIDLLLEHDVAIVPTFTVYWAMMHHGSKTVPASVRRTVEKAWGRKQAAFQRAHASGVRIVAGTDSGPPAAQHGHIARELELLVEAGMSPIEALRAATLEAARLLGVADSVGTLAPGKVANLVLVEGDPTTDVRAMWRVRSVFRAGCHHDASHLRASRGAALEEDGA